MKSLKMLTEDIQVWIYIISDNYELQSSSEI